MNWNLLADKALSGGEISRDEAGAVLTCPDESLLGLLDAAYRVRRAHFGKRVKLNFLLNAKSGLCPEDCFYCSQSKISDAQIDKYPFMTEKEIVEAAGRAVEVKAKRFCMVNSGRGPTDGEIALISSAVTKVKAAYPKLEVCVCLGLLGEKQGHELKKCGVDAYNHNLNTSENQYSDICTTHTYKDRVQTVQTAKDCGMSSCSGCLFGMGEGDRDVLDLAYSFRKMDVDSIPINFLIPIQGTPLEKFKNLTPRKCLKILALFRFLNPKTEIRAAGGREINLRWLQPLALYAANSIFIGDYLTTKGQSPKDDISMIRDLGFEIEGDDGTPFIDKKEKISADPCKEEDFAVRLK